MDRGLIVFYDPTKNLRIKECSSRKRQLLSWSTYSLPYMALGVALVDSVYKTAVELVTSDEAEA
jgi:hypothetical protein